MSTVTIEDTEVLQSLDFPILCESGYCQDANRGIHVADWFWDLPCVCGSVPVCDTRRVEFIEDELAICYAHDEDLTPLNTSFIKITE